MNLPDGWTIRPVRELGERRGGGTPSRKVPAYFKGEIPWLTVADLPEVGAIPEVITEAREYVTDTAIRESSAKRLPKGSVLFATRVSVGKTAIAGREVATNQDFRSLLPSDFFDAKYVAHFLSFVARFRPPEDRGSTINGITADTFDSIEVPLPPTVDEQRRIAAKLDRIAAHLDDVRARLDTVPGILKRFRMAAVGAAMPGNGAPEVLVGNLLVEPLANGRSVPDAKTGFPVLRLTALKNGSVDLNERKVGQWSHADAERFLVKKGDFFIARGNGSLRLVGKGGLVVTDPDPVAFPDTLIRVRVDPSRLDPRYLRIVWNGVGVRSQLESVARTTAGIWKISQADIVAVRIALPPLGEQVELVRRVEALLKQADAIEARYNKARVYSEKVMPSVLAKAFRGELAC